MCLWWWCALSSGSHYLWLENQAAQNLWPRRLLLITCKAMLRDRYYSRPSSRLYGHFRCTIMSFPSFPKWKAIRIDVMRIWRRYVDLAVVNFLVTFKFELWLGYYVDLLETRYYNSLFLRQKVRMVTSTLSRNSMNCSAILVNHSLYDHNQFYTLRVVHSTSVLCFGIGGDIQ